MKDAAQGALMLMEDRSSTEKRCKEVLRCHEVLQDLGFTVSGLGFWVQGSEVRVSSLRIRSLHRAWGLGLRKSSETMMQGDIYHRDFGDCGRAMIYIYIYI